jgi:hypothetical protein
MEKILYPVWKAEEKSGDEFRDELINKLGPVILGIGVRGLRVSVVDSDVDAAAGLRMQNTQPVMDAMVSVWLDSSVYRAPVEEAIAAHCARYAGYLVTESEPIVNNDHPPVVGERTHGMAQVVFLQRPHRISEQQWLEVWHGSHTQVAIDTQSTFGYRQNVIARPVTYAAPPYDAVIEEHFPPEAMDSQHAFYGVADDEALAENRQAMIDSCVRFIDFDKIDCVPTSEYVLKLVGS